MMKIMENPIKIMDDLGKTHHFRKKPIYCNFKSSVFKVPAMFLHHGNLKFPEKTFFSWPFFHDLKTVAFQNCQFLSIKMPRFWPVPWVWTATNWTMMVQSFIMVGNTSCFNQVVQVHRSRCFCWPRFFLKIFKYFWQMFTHWLVSIRDPTWSP